MCVPQLILSVRNNTNLLCNRKGDLVGGTWTEAVSLWSTLLSLFVGKSEFRRGCCCLRTSTLGPARDIYIYETCMLKWCVFQSMCSELTWSMSIDSCRWRDFSDGFVPFSGQELHSENHHVISFIHTHTHKWFLCLHVFHIALRSLPWDGNNNLYGRPKPPARSALGGGQRRRTHPHGGNQT